MFFFIVKSILWLIDLFDLDPRNIVSIISIVLSYFFSIIFLVKFSIFSKMFFFCFFLCFCFYFFSYFSFFYLYFLINTKHINFTINMLENSCDGTLYIDF